MYDEVDLDRPEELVAYIDNATIINACSLLSGTATFDIYKLLDLESFCEAFLFYDAVRTLVGSSFMSGLRSGAGIYHNLLMAKILRPSVRRAGTMRYHVEHIDELDEIAKHIDVESLIANVKQVFGDTLPWESPFEEGEADEWDSELKKRVPLPKEVAGTRKASWVIALGEEMQSRDSDPIYYFGVPSEDRTEPAPKFRGVSKEEWELNNRRTDWQDTFVSQTFYYLVESSLQRKPFIGSSVRMPIVQDLVGKLNGAIYSVVNASLSAVAESAKKKVETVVQFLGMGSMQFVSIPALAYVLQEAKSREDFFPALIRLRENEKIKGFRKWCKRVEGAWQAEDVGLVLQALDELRKVTQEIASASSLEPVSMDLAHLADVRMLTRKGQEQIASNDQALVTASYSPTLVGLRDVGSYLTSAGKHLGSFEEKFGVTITKGDRDMLAALIAKRNSLYSPGRLTEPIQQVHLTKVEVSMGDTFSNISNATIATRGSSAVGQSHIQAAGNEDLAKALRDLQALIQGQHGEALNEERRNKSQELVDTALEEATKENPRQSVLHSMSESLFSLLKSAPVLAEGATKVVELIHALK